MGNEKKLADIEICRDGIDWIVKVGLANGKFVEFKNTNGEDAITEMQKYLSDEIDEDEKKE